MPEPTRDPRLLSAERLAEIQAAHAKEDVGELFREGSALVHHRHRQELLAHIAAVELLHAEVVLAATELADWCEQNGHAVDRRAILKDRLKSLARCRQTGEPPVLWVFMRRCDELEAHIAAQDQRHAALVAASTQLMDTPKLKNCDCPTCEAVRDALAALAQPPGDESRGD